MGGDPQRPLLSLAGGGGHRAAVPSRPLSASSAGGRRFEGPDEERDDLRRRINEPLLTPDYTSLPLSALHRQRQRSVRNLCGA